jgi:hypothetical protein
VSQFWRSSPLSSSSMTETPRRHPPISLATHTRHHPPQCPHHHQKNQAAKRKCRPCSHLIHEGVWNSIHIIATSQINLFTPTEPIRRKHALPLLHDSGGKSCGRRCCWMSLLSEPRGTRVEVTRLDHRRVGGRLEWSMLLTPGGGGTGGEERR